MPRSYLAENVLVCAVEMNGESVDTTSMSMNSSLASKPSQSSLWAKYSWNTGLPFPLSAGATGASASVGQRGSQVLTALPQDKSHAGQPGDHNTGKSLCTDNSVDC